MSEKIGNDLNTPPNNAASENSSSQPELLKNSEEFIKSTVYEATQLIQSENYSAFIKNSYLVATLYYSKIARQKIIQKAIKTPNEEIVSKIAEMITPEVVEKYVQSLEENNKANESSLEQNKLPLDSINVGNYWTVNHQDALDLFITEGSPIYSMCEGVVVLAESNWQENNNLSATSHRGGNNVIIFNPARKEFYRYAHLEKTFVKAGDKVDPSTTIGTVGHTGMNASKVGHGEHLHLEINSYKEESRETRALSNEEIIDRLDTALEAIDKKKIVRLYGIGSKTKDVYKFQNKLIEKGFIISKATGTFGQETSSAVKEFQKVHNLRPDGILGPETTALLLS